MHYIFIPKGEKIIFFQLFQFLRIRCKLLRIVAKNHFITEEDTSDEDFFGEDSDFFRDLLDEDEEREEKQRGLEVQASKFMPVNQQVWSLKFFGGCYFVAIDSPENVHKISFSAIPFTQLVPCS